MKRGQSRENLTGAKSRKDSAFTCVTIQVYDEIKLRSFAKSVMAFFPF